MASRKGIRLKNAPLPKQTMPTIADQTAGVIAAPFMIHEEVWVVKFLRNPAELYEAFLDNEELAACRSGMMAAAMNGGDGHASLMTVMTDAFFCAPHQTDAIVKHLFNYGVHMVLPSDREMYGDGKNVGGAISFEDLSRDYIVCTDPFVTLVDNVVNSLPKRLRIKNGFGNHATGRFTIVELNGECIVFDTY